jgi:predicted transposase/invertase (TIGR01784 family)
MRSRLDPKLDIVFKLLFAEERNKPLLLSLLNAVLRPDAPIQTVTVLPSEPAKDAVDDKGIALDLRVGLATGEQVDIEMQSQPRPAGRERALYYWARLYGSQLSRGDHYPALRRCVVVLITDFSELDSSRFHSIFRVQEAHDHSPLTEQLEIHLVELPKLPQASTIDEPDLVLWAKFLSAHSDQELESLAMNSPVIQQATEALDRLSADPQARALAEQRELALISYQLDLGKVHAQGRAEGRAEGEAKGRAEGKAETLRKLLTLKFGQPPEGALLRMNAAKEHDLDRWLERVLTADSLDAVLT